MKVWVGFYCHDNLADVFRKVEKVFDDEVKALLWVEDKEFADNAEKFDGYVTEWREYVEMKVE